MAPGDAFAPLITNTPKRPPPPADLTQPPDAFSDPQHGPAWGIDRSGDRTGHIVAELKPKCSARLVIRCLQRKRVYLAGGSEGVGPRGEGIRLAVDKPAEVASSEVLPVTRARPAGAHLGQETVAF